MSVDKFLPFAMPDISEDEINEVVDSLSSGWITTGPKTKLFEESFAGYIGSSVEAIAVNSATAGLHLALEAIGIGRGDEVITTPYTFTATAEVIRYLGANPVFVDIDTDTFNIDVTKIEEKITSKTKAIIPVHFAGLACDMQAIIELARRYGLSVIEDAAHALPCRYQGEIVGSLQTDASVFSFYATKTITTGEGGMIVTRNQKIAERCRIMRLHGISRDVFDRYTSEKASWQYEVVAPGFKYNMTDISASIGIHQLKKADMFQERRQQLAEYYDEELKALPLVLPPRPPGDGLHSWHLYVIRLTDQAPVVRDEFISRMSHHKIGCSVHFIPLHLHRYWRESCRLGPDDFPSALYNYERAVSLPLYTKMTDGEAARVTDAVKDILSGKGC